MRVVSVARGVVGVAGHALSQGVEAMKHVFRGFGGGMPVGNLENPMADRFLFCIKTQFLSCNSLRFHTCG